MPERLIQVMIGILSGAIAALAYHLITRKKKKMSRRGSFFGFGILYLLVHIPCIWWVKIGITGYHIGSTKRAKQIDRAVFGFPLPVFFVPTFFCRNIEQALHRNLKPLSARFYVGDGSTEWFWLPAALFALAVMLSIYGAYWLVGVWVFNHFFSTI